MQRYLLLLDVLLLQQIDEINQKSSVTNYNLKHFDLKKFNEEMRNVKGMWCFWSQTKYSSSRLTDPNKQVEEFHCASLWWFNNRINLDNNWNFTFSWRFNIKINHVFIRNKIHKIFFMFCCNIQTALEQKRYLGCLRGLYWSCLSSNLSQKTLSHLSGLKAEDTLIEEEEEAFRWQKIW